MLLKVIKTGTIRKLGCGFQFAFYSRNAAVLYRVRDIATCWSKFAKFLYLTCIQHPCRGYKRGLCRYAVSVRPSVCHVRVLYFCILSKPVVISSNFVTVGSHAILVFPYKTLWQYSDGDPPNGSVECRCVRQNSRFSTNIWFWRR